MVWIFRFAAAALGLAALVQCVNAAVLKVWQFGVAGVLTLAWAFCLEMIGRHCRDVGSGVPLDRTTAVWAVVAVLCVVGAGLTLSTLGGFGSR